MYRNWVKPIGDLLVSISLLIVLLPIVIITGVILFIFNKGDILFFQQRPGLNCKPFWIMKFKTMRDIYDGKGQLLTDDKRLTKVGKIIRSASLDELLQLLNVIKGDMSLIGPRPLLMKYLPRYTPQQMKRHNLKPGITGWAQVNGRNAIGWDQKFELDNEYVQKQSFFLDMLILWLTFIRIIQRRGIEGKEQVTMEEFMG